jgi:F0F1-type ATP synthase assembly protein I
VWPTHWGSRSRIEKKKKKEKDQLEDLLKKKIDAQQRQQKFRNEREKNLLNCVKLIKRYQRR